MCKDLECKPLKPYILKLKVRDGLLFFEHGDGVVPVVPFPLLVEVAMHLHYQQGHPGRNKLQHSIQASVWHPSLSQVVADVCASCTTCQFNKVAAVRPSIPIIKIRASQPFQLVAADLVLLPRTNLGHVGCLVLVDHCSKWLSCIPIRSKTSRVVSSAFEHRVLPFLPVKPLKLLTDNGPEFTSAEFENLLNKFGISHVYSTPYRPASNGAVERTNRTILEMLRCLGGEHGTTWDALLSQTIMNYNSSWHSQILMSPSYFLLKLSHKMANVPALLTDITTYWREGHPNFSPFHLGDQVLKRSVLLGHRVSNKMVARFSGPFSVTRVQSNGLTYMISRGSVTSKVHHSQLKRFNPVPSYISTSPFLRSILHSYDAPEFSSAYRDSDSDESDTDATSLADFSGFDSPSNSGVSNGNFSGFKGSLVPKAPAASDPSSCDFSGFCAPLVPGSCSVLVGSDSDVDVPLDLCNVSEGTPFSDSSSSSCSGPSIFEEASSDWDDESSSLGQQSSVSTTSSCPFGEEGMLHTYHIPPPPFCSSPRADKTLPVCGRGTKLLSDIVGEDSINGVSTSELSLAELFKTVSTPS